MNATLDIFDVERVGSAIVLTPRRDLRELEFRQIREEVLRFSEDPLLDAVVVDLGHTDYLGSTALGMLTRLYQQVKRRGGRAAYCNLSEHEREILRVTGLEDVWPIFASRDEALAAVAG